MRRTSAYIAICVAILSGSLFAQLPLRDEWLGLQSDPITAEVIQVLGDIDNDGVDDLIVGKGSDYVDYGSGFVVGTGRSAVVSGHDGSILIPHWGPQLNSLYGSSLAVLGDLNGDGKNDFAAGAPGFSLGGSATNLGLIAFVSGANGAVIDFVFGSQNGAKAGAKMTALGDITGDGKIDVCYSESLGGPTGAPTLRLRSGANRTLIRTINPSTSQVDWTVGIALANAGDVNNDGIPDLALGTPGATISSTANVGAVRFYSGANGALLGTASGTLAGGRVGAAVISIGDRNGDGHGDVAVGVPGAGLVRIISGSDRSVIQTISGGTEFGRSFATGRDLNADGTVDLAVGALGNDQIVVFSGVDYSMLKVIRPWQSGQVISNGLAMINDVNNDEFNEMISTVTGDIAQINAGLPVSGLAQLSIAGNREFGAPGGVQPLTLQWVDIPLADPSFGGFICSGATPFASGVAGVSLAADVTMIDTLPLYLAVDSMNLITSANFGFNGVGDLIYPLALRNPTVAGTTFHVQIFQSSPPYGASNRLELLYTR